MDEATILRVLSDGELAIDGRIAWGSNYTFLGRVCLEEHELSVIYKPQRGEQPLWDFASGTLCQRERAAFLVSQMLTWDLVPPTVLRDGRFGRGSVQLFVEHDPEVHYFTFQNDPACAPQLRRIVLFDLLTNNADRKSGHVLRDADGKLWAIDHGICFHSDYKLRTVIWDFAGQPLTAEERRDLAHLAAQLADSPAAAELAGLLSARELRMLRRRVENLATSERFPLPGPGRPYPWPPV